MTHHFTSRHAAVAVAGSVLVALSFSGVAQAITDNVFRYSSTKTGFYGISSLDLTPQNSDTAPNYSSDAAAGLFKLLQNGCFGTGIHLPNGATITAVRVWYASGATGDPTVSLRQVAFVQFGVANIIASKTLADNSGTLKVTNVNVPEPHKVDNSSGIYALQVCLTPNDTFFAMRITYTYETAGD
jgi:hypothetical protein